MMRPDGPVLALDSATSTGSVAVGDAEGVIAEVVLNVAGTHSAALLPAVDQVLRTAGLRRGDLRAVAVGAGPGSFTGVRIAAATAKGIVQGLELPLYAYSSLLAAAVAAWGAPDEVCALFDARRRDVYAAAYRIGNREQGTGNRGGTAGSGGGDTVPRSLAAAGGPGGDSLFPGNEGEGGAVAELLEPSALSLDDVLERYRARRAPVFVGDAAARHAAELRRELGARVLPPHLGVPRASALLWLVGADPARGRVDDPAAWEPDYVRASGAERIAAARGAGDAPGR